MIVIIINTRKRINNVRLALNNTISWGKMSEKTG
jgi:hypothetical protein